MTKAKPAPKDEPVGGGLYIDQRGKSKSYLWRGRVNGKSVRMVLRHPQTGDVATTVNMTLTEARIQVKVLKGDAASGGTKHFQHVLAKPKAGDFTIAQAWALYMERDASALRKRTIDRKESNYRRFIAPAWAERTARSITTKECRALLATVLADFESRMEAGTPVIKLHEDMNCLFRFCLKRFETGVTTNPMMDNGEVIPIPVRSKAKPARALDEEELVWFFQAAEEWATAPLSKQAIRRSANAPAMRRRAVEATEALLRASGRRDEIFTAEWGWIKEGGLLVPASKAKMGIAILVPLTASMLVLIGERPADAKDSDPIFGASSSWLMRAIEGIRPIMTRLAGGNGDFASDGDPRHFTLHNFRDTVMTLLKAPKNEWKQPIFGRDVRNALLNHRAKGDVGNRLYDADIDDPDWMYEERKGAGEFWNDWLDRLKAKALADIALAA